MLLTKNMEVSLNKYEIFSKIRNFFQLMYIYNRGPCTCERSLAAGGLTRGPMFLSVSYLIHVTTTGSMATANNLLSSSTRNFFILPEMLVRMTS